MPQSLLNTKYQSFKFIVTDWHYCHTGPVSVSPSVSEFCTLAWTSLDAPTASRNSHEAMYQSALSMRSLLVVSFE